MTTAFSLQDIVDEMDAPRDRTSDVVRVVVAGEFETGKSSVINALLRKPVLPCNPGFRGRPQVKIRHAMQPKVEAEDRVGRTFEPAFVDELIDLPNLAICDIQMPMPGMERIEIVEIPFHHESGFDSKVRQLMADADLLIWVTIASQAWRLSEKSVVAALPRAMRERSILAISRADKLRSIADLDKIETRLQKEASDYFSEIVFMQASPEHLRRAASDVAIWQQTGGAALASITDDIVSAVSSPALKI